MRILNVANTSFSAICENKILENISEFTVFYTDFFLGPFLLLRLRCIYKYLYKHYVGGSRPS